MLLPAKRPLGQWYRSVSGCQEESGSCREGEYKSQ